MVTSKCFFGEGDQPLKQLEFSLDTTVVVPDGFELDTSAWGAGGSAEKEMPLRRAVIEVEYGVSSGHVGYEDVFLVHGGRLDMSLCEATYLRAGLEAKRVGRLHRYLASFDLAKENKRLHWALNNTLTDGYRFSVQTEAPAEVAVSTHTWQVPDLDPPTDNEGLQDWANCVGEWVGLACLDAAILDPGHRVEPSLCDCHIDGSPMRVKKVRIRGFLTSNTLEKIWHSVAGASWAVVNICAYEHAPVVFARPHSILQTGEAGLTLIKHDSKTCYLQVKSWGDL